MYPSTLIRRVEDADGQVLFQGKASFRNRRSVRSRRTLMADMLRGVIDRGTGYRARQLGFSLPAGGKTGTTNDYRDAWFIGFTPSIVTGVWVGHDQPRDDSPQRVCLGAGGADVDEVHEGGHEGPSSRVGDSPARRDARRARQPAAPAPAKLVVAGIRILKNPAHPAPP